jgi:hypothetical protein
VETEVSLDYPGEVDHWPDGSARPDQCVGVSPEDPKAFRVFKNERDRRNAGYQLVGGTPVVMHSWADYAKTLSKS